MKGPRFQKGDEGRLRVLVDEARNIVDDVVDNAPQVLLGRVLSDVAVGVGLLFSHGVGFGLGGSYESEDDGIGRRSWN